MQIILKKFEKIQKLVEDLKQQSESETTLIIVEGRKDVQSLQELGIRKNIIQLQGRPFIEICDLAVKFMKIILLPDFDTQGQKLLKTLQEKLNTRGLNVDLKYYRKLKFYFKKISKDIEGISKIFQKIKQIKS